MNKRTNAMMNMAETSLAVLDKYPTEWNGSAPANRRVTEIKGDYATIRTALQSGSVVSTGITDDKEDAGDMAIALAMTLVGLTQTYAEETKNGKLLAQMQITAGALDNMGDNELVLKLRELHRLMAAVGQPLVEYNVTAAKLDALKTAIDKFDNMKQAPRLAVGNRSASNASVPALVKKVQAAFKSLDRILKGLDDTDPQFVAEYKKARVVIYLRGRKEDEEDKKDADTGKK